MEQLSVAMRAGSKLHKRISDAVHRRLQMSYRGMNKYYSAFAKAEEQYRAYLPEREADALRRRVRDTSGLPQYTTIEVPYSYATLLTAHTYFTSVFLSRNPIFQYMGRHGRAQSNEAAVEALIDYSVFAGNILPHLYVWLYDPGKYSFGVVGVYWDREVTTCRKIVEQQAEFFGLKLSKKVKRELVEEVLGFQGNKLFNVRPQDFFPDTRFPLWRFQSGEFCGRYVEIPWNEVLEGQRRGSYFNVDIAAKEAKGEHVGGDVFRDTGSSAVSDIPNDLVEPLLEKEDAPGVLKAHEFFWRIRPSEWGLATGNKTEIWVFRRTTAGTLVSAMPLGSYLDKFPFSVLETEPDGYNLLPPSMLQMILPLNNVLSWLINTHFYNVRAALNNQFIVDPSMVVMKDLENPNPGKLIRLKPMAMGRDVRTFFHQVQVADVTRSNIADAEVVVGMMQRMNGVSDQIMGMLESGGRRTATESRIGANFGVNRLKTTCEFMSALGFAPLAQQMLANAQQHYSGEMKLRLVGDQAQFANEDFLQVTPEMIAGNYDYVPVDGSLPVDRYAQVNLWNQILAQMAQAPAVLANYDISKIFAYVANLGGIKNLNQFRVQVVSDATAAAAARAGNVVPLGGAAPGPAGFPTPPRPNNMGAAG